MNGSSKKESTKKRYEKPVLTEITFPQEEAALAGCKLTTSGVGARGYNNKCTGIAGACNQTAVS
jgi:hypothetical protein